MERKKKLFFISECLLNQNIRAYGVGNMNGSGAVKDILDIIVQHDIGLTVVPCPEIPYEGLKRKACNKECYDNKIYRVHCKKMVQDMVDRCTMYIDDNYKVGGFICVNGSPSCAADYCFRGADTSFKCNEQGVFVEELQKLLHENNINLPLIGIRFKDIGLALEKIQKIIEELA